MSKILTYVNGVLTIISGDKKFIGEIEKPSFITGINLYYEDTQKIMDGEGISGDLESNIIAFIDAFEFPVENRDPEVKFYVDQYGFYRGTEDGEGYVEVSVAPEKGVLNPILVGDVYYPSAVFSTESQGFLGYGDYKNFENGHPVPIKDLDVRCDLETHYYDFVDDKLKLSLHIVKVLAKARMERGLDNEVTKTYSLSDYADLEKISFESQYEEASAVLADSTADTPLLDGIVTGRGMGETIEELASKIMQHRTLLVAFGEDIGKYQAKIKLIDSLNVVSEIDAVEW